MEENILISVVIPLYNAEKYIRETLESIICQKDIGYEIIIINDGSTDTSPDICREYLGERVMLLNQINSGAPAARNRGLARAKGKYILFLDADDCLCKDCFEHLFQVLCQNDYTCIIGNFVRVNQGKEIIDNVYLSSEVDIEHLFMTPPYPCNKLYLKSFLLENKLAFSEIRITQDLNFFYKFLGIVSVETVKFVDLNICRYRFVENSISHSMDARILDICKSVDDCEEYYIRNNVKTERFDIMHLSSLRNICYQMEKCPYFREPIEGANALVILKKYWKQMRKKVHIHYNTFFLWRLLKADLLYLYTLINIKLQSGKVR